MPIPRDAIESDEAAKILGVTVNYLHQLVHRELVPAERVGRSLVFCKKVIERIAAHRNETKPGLAVNPRPRSKTKWGQSARADQRPDGDGPTHSR